MKRTNKFARFMILSLKWLANCTNSSGSLFHPERILRKVLLILETRGKKAAITFCKEGRAAIFSYFELKDLSGDIGEPFPSDGLPRDLRFLRHIKRRGGYPLLRLTLSALYVSRALETPAVPNMATITGAPIGGLPPGFDRFVKDFWRELGYNPCNRGVPSSARWKGFHLTTKVGPNGHALWKSIADLSALPPDLVKSIAFIGGSRLESRIVKLFNSPVQSLLDFIIPVWGRKYRKISAIPDQEGKTREIAILDYWSQTALYGLHQYLFGVLKKIPQDCTFNQGSFKDKLPPHEGNIHLYQSVDLTAATDRFPIEAIEIVLRGRFPLDYVNHWHNIMVGYPFDSRLGPIRYSVGNPMGAYSSWNSFTVAHHYVVYYCCRVLRIEWASLPYVILGDDIVINNNLVAKKYMEVMSLLGVEISLQKSHISPIMYEFAKRTFHCGKEITPFPLGALWSTKLSMSNIVNVVDSEFTYKNWDTSLETPVAVIELYKFQGLPSRVIKKMTKGIYTIFHLLEALSGRKLAHEAVKSLVVAFHPTLSVQIKPERWPSFSRTMIRESIRTMYLRSANLEKILNSLGNISNKIQGALVSDYNNFDAEGLRFSIPHVEVYQRLIRKAQSVYMSNDSFFSLLEGNWKDTLRAFTVPLSDDIFIQRNQHIKVHAASELGKVLHTLLEGQYKTDPGWDFGPNWIPPNNDPPSVRSHDPTQRQKQSFWSKVTSFLWKKHH